MLFCSFFQHIRILVFGQKMIKICDQGELSIVRYLSPGSYVIRIEFQVDNLTGL